MSDINAQINITGTIDAGVFAIQGPVGPKGDTGDVGPKGDTGDVGPVGPKGDAGDVGPVGPKGDTGDLGPVGPKGDTGDVGPVGPKGDTGDVGPVGPKGDTGEVGPVGPAGADGSNGSDGADGEDGSDAGITPLSYVLGSVENSTDPTTILQVVIPGNTVNEGADIIIRPSLHATNGTLTNREVNYYAKIGGQSEIITGHGVATEDERRTVPTLSFKREGTTILFSGPNSTVTPFVYAGLDFDAGFTIEITATLEVADAAFSAECSSASAFIEHGNAAAAGNGIITYEPTLASCNNTDDEITVVAQDFAPNEWRNGELLELNATQLIHNNNFGGATVRVKFGGQSITIMSPGSGTGAALPPAANYYLSELKVQRVGNAFIVGSQYSVDAHAINANGYGNLYNNVQMMSGPVNFANASTFEVTVQHEEGATTRLWTMEQATLQKIPATASTNGGVNIVNNYTGATPPFAIEDITDLQAELDSKMESSLAFPLASGRFHTAPSTGQATTTAIVVDRLYGVPFLLQHDTSFDAIAIQLGTAVASSNVRLGIYNDSNGLPGALRTDLGTVSTAGAAGVVSLPISQTLPKGRYWLALVGSHAPSIIFSINNSSMNPHLGFGTTSLNGRAQHVFGTHTYGPLPASFPAVTFATATFPVIALKAV